MPSNDPMIAALHRFVESFTRRSMQDFVLYSKDSGLSMPQVGALFRIHKSAINVSDLGEELGVTSAAASQMLERLVQLQLILRTEDPDDRRIKRLALTSKGRRVLQDALHIRQNWMGELANSLSESEKEQVAAALNLLADKANQLDRAAGRGN